MSKLYKINRPFNKVLKRGVSLLYKFDFTNAEQKIKDLFIEFKTENKELTEKKRFDDFIEECSLYDDWVYENYIYQNGITWDDKLEYIYIKRVEMESFTTNQKNKWFQQRLTPELYKILPSKGPCNYTKFLKKTINNRDNPHYSGGNAFCLFALFCKYCTEVYYF
jgi:hypothetical protein